MNQDFPTFNDYLGKKSEDPKENSPKRSKEDLWDNIDPDNEVKEFPAFEDYLSKKIKKDLGINREIKIEIEETDQAVKNPIPDHIIEALSKVSRDGNIINIQDPDYLEKSRKEYYKELEKERKKISNFPISNKPTKQIKIKYCFIGTAIIGECRIG